MEDLQFEAEFLTWNQASQNSFTFACHLTSTIGIRVSWDPCNPDWIASAANTELAQVMIDTQHSIRIQLNNAETRATVVEIREEGKWVNMQTEHGETFLMKTEVHLHACVWVVLGKLYGLRGSTEVEKGYSQLIKSLWPLRIWYY